MFLVRTCRDSPVCPTQTSSSCSQQPPPSAGDTLQSQVRSVVMQSNWTSQSDVTACVYLCVCVSVALLLHRRECYRSESGLRLSVGCPVLDELLRGGLPVGGVTELAGESGAGKTQLALQLCLSVQYPTQHGGLNSGQLTHHYL